MVLQQKTFATSSPEKLKEHFFTCCTDPASENPKGGLETLQKGPQNSPLGPGKRFGKRFQNRSPESVTFVAETYPGVCCPRALDLENWTPIIYRYTHTHVQVWRMFFNTRNNTTTYIKPSVVLNNSLNVAWIVSHLKTCPIRQLPTVVYFRWWQCVI